jgi:hypothetical protein
MWTRATFSSCPQAHLETNRRQTVLLEGIWQNIEAALLCNPVTVRNLAEPSPTGYLGPEAMVFSD